MQKIKVGLLTLLSLYSLTVTAFARDIFGIQSVLGTPDPPAACIISAVKGEVLEFTAADLERRLGLADGSLGGITITAVPPSVQGGLFLDGVEVQPYDFLERQELNRLCFVPGDAAVSASLTFLPQSKDAAPTTMAIRILAGSNLPPTLEDAAIQTLPNTVVRGTMAASDPENGPLTLQLVQRPQKGSVTFDGLSFRYEPYQGKTGADSFSVCAIDSACAYSREAIVNVLIEGDSSGFSYVDMAANPSAYAAQKLHAAGIFIGETVGGASFFHPGRTVSRGDFLVRLLAASGNNDLAPTINTGLPNDQDFPAWLKPYIAAALRADILPAGQVFAYTEIPTRGEAVVMVDRAAAITDVKDYALTMPDLSEIPGWALPSYKDLAAYRMLDLHDGYARPSDALTNSYAADLIWQLYKHANQ